MPNPPAPAKGTRHPGAGRKPGTPNKSTQSVKDRLAELGCHPFEFAALVMANKLECGVCRGKGKTKFQAKSSIDDAGERICQSCWGSKLERIDPDARLAAAKELMKYVAPQLKAIEHSGADDKPPVRVTVEYVE